MTNRTTLAAVLAALTLTTALAAAGTTVPFQAAGHRVHLSIEKVHGGTHILNAIPDGESDLGDWEGAVDLTVTGANVTGTLVLTFDAGDTLTVGFKQKWTSKVGNFGGTAGEYVVTGGTGRLAGAGGGGMIAAVYLDKDQVNVLIQLDGVILLP
jgi:hypothetical protein